MLKNEFFLSMFSLKMLTFNTVKELKSRSIFIRKEKLFKEKYFKLFFSSFYPTWNMRSKKRLERSVKNVTSLHTSRNLATVVSTTIKGRWIKWTTPFFTGIFATTISARTTPAVCFESPTTVFDLTYAVNGIFKKCSTLLE